MSSLNVVVNKFLGAVQQSSHSSALVRWTLQALALSQAFLSTGWPDDYNLHDGDTFDFIVVGSGSAGAVVAARLSEVPNWRVLLIEAGGDPPPASVVPSLFATLAHTKYDWDYKGLLNNDVGNSHANRKLFMTRGKMLGGSSSINYEFYSRGVPQDYEEWDKVAPGWNWNNAFHYFMKLENMTDSTILNNPLNSQWHSTQGPLKISRPSKNKYFSKVSDHVLSSYQELGIKRILENNGPEIFGASTPHFTFYDGRRSSTAEAYLKPTKDRPNLFIAKHTRAIKILIDKNNKAYGVNVLNSENMMNVYFNIEVIISAGSIDTPKLLMLSGIGPKEELRKHNIDMVVDLPVGRNLHDHQVVPIVYSGRFGLKTAKQNFMVLNELNSYPVPVQNGFFSINSSSYRPQFQITNLRAGAAASAIMFFGCLSITNYDNNFCNSLAKANALHEIDFSFLVLLHPLSRGKVSLRNRNPLEDPVIEMGYYRNQNDVDLMTDGIKFMLSLVNTTYYRKIASNVVRLDVNGCNELTWGTDKYWECYARNTVGSLLHPVGTCAMGPNGVVNERLKVHNVSDIRIVDASIMPEITSGNTNVPTVMIGEKAADMIKFDYLDYNTYLF